MIQRWHRTGGKTWCQICGDIWHGWVGPVVIAVGCAWTLDIALSYIGEEHVKQLNVMFLGVLATYALRRK